jgi:hypothetical protein
MRKTFQEKALAKRNGKAVPFILILISIYVLYALFCAVSYTWTKYHKTYTAHEDRQTDQEMVIPYPPFQATILCLKDDYYCRFMAEAARLRLPKRSGV